MIEESTRAVLIADGTVSGLIGTRVYPLKMPQPATMPSVVYMRISGPRDVSLDGASGSGRARLRYNCWAETYSGAKTLLEAVRAALDGISGAVAATSETDFYDDDGEAYVASIDYYIHHTEV